MRLDSFKLYETVTEFHIIGHLSTSPYDSYKIFRLNREESDKDKPLSLASILTIEPYTYTNKQVESYLSNLLNITRELNNGSVLHVLDAVGIVGFPRFLGCYYITLITQRKQVGCIRGQKIYQIKQVEIIPIQSQRTTGGSAVTQLFSTLHRTFNKSQQDTAEARYLGLYNFIDMSKDFYYSYSYDLTKSLQGNFSSNSSASSSTSGGGNDGDYFNEDFLWNSFQMSEFTTTLNPNATSSSNSNNNDIKNTHRDTSLWRLPIIHGSFHQKRFDIFGKPLEMILIARRSIHYAGKRMNNKE